VIPRKKNEQEGQVMTPLLLVVVFLIFLALMFSQVGSSGDQAVQTQTAADSGSVTGAHILRDAGISRTVQRDVAGRLPSARPSQPGYRRRPRVE
jgi:hypothetical protein